MIEISDDNFETEVLGSNLPVLVDFFADWCGPCQSAAPILEKLASDYQNKAKFCKVNVDSSPQLAGKYSVMSIPTMIVFKNGQEVKRQIGFPGEEGIKSLLDSVLSG